MLLSDGSIRNGYTVKVLNKVAEPRAVTLSLQGLEGATMMLAGFDMPEGARGLRDAGARTASGTCASSCACRLKASSRAPRPSPSTFEEGQGLEAANLFRHLPRTGVEPMSHISERPPASSRAGTCSLILIAFFGRDHRRQREPWRRWPTEAGRVSWSRTPM